MTADRLEPALITRPRQAVELTESESWRFLGSVSIGRVVFTERAMPAIRPVNHYVDDRHIIIRTHAGASIASQAMDGTVVCYEADDIHPSRHTGWSVIVTGLARLVTDAAEIARHSSAVQPWVAGDMNQVISIEPHIISGIRLVGWCA